MSSDQEDLWLGFPGTAGQQEARRRPGKQARQVHEQRKRQAAGDGQDRGHTPRRARGLSTAQIVRAAITVADAEGAEAVSMRRIARELRSGTMSLYWYVESKEILLDLMMDAVEGEMPVTAPSGDWRADLHAMAAAYRSVLRRHPWLMDFIGGRPPLGPNMLRNTERQLGILDGLGLDVFTELIMLTTVATYVIGTVLRELREIRVEQRDEELLGHLSKAERDEMFIAQAERLRATGEFPRLLRIVDSGIDPDDAETRDARFEFGLACVLDGIAVRVQQPASQQSRSTVPGAGDIVTEST